MTTRHLDRLFDPKSVALFGATDRAGAVGQVVWRNLRIGGFKGPIWPVNPSRALLDGVKCYADVAALPVPPDLAVIATPPATVPGLIDALGRRGTRAAVVITAGLNDQAQAMVEAARVHELRILGANCLGVLVPGIGLNASFAHVTPTAGGMALVSQSGAICTVMLDWAAPRRIGFSHVVSLGNADDADFGDVIDYLGDDPNTRAILLYIESIRARRSFMSAARAAARDKPILVIKAGRAAEGAKAALSHTGALAGSDQVYDAAIRRAGMLRVFGIGELFAAVETLARARPLGGERLAIVTNGGGLGVMAVDELIARGGRLAELAPETVAALDKVLPPTWSRGNPIDIIGDAPGERYVAALEVLTQATGIDALLVMHAPTAVVSPVDAAQAVVDVARRAKIPVLTSWVGEAAVAPARRLLEDAGLPSYETPGTAVRAFLHMADYRRNQDLLMQTPPSQAEDFTPDTAEVRAIVAAALGSGVRALSEIDAKRVLSAYGIPVVETRAARDAAEAVRVAAEIGFPVALKVLSPDISHKSDVGGVALNLADADAVAAAARAMLDSVADKAPKARIDGFTVQRMAAWRHAHELILGVANDAIFGPVILFGEGGTAVEVIGDRAIALPPLNAVLARELVSRTRVSRLLAGYRDRLPIDMDALVHALVRLSQLVVDIPEIRELDINPLFADESGVIALDARIGIAAFDGNEAERLAIAPYPKGLEENFALRDGRDVVIRPIRPEDEPQHYDFIAHLTPDDIRFRFFGLIGRMSHAAMARLTQIDYAREMAFIASASEAEGPKTLGVVRAVIDPARESAEFAIVVRSDLKGLGLGYRLLAKMIDYVRVRGARELVGEVLADNVAMRKLASDLGFVTEHGADTTVVRVRLPLSGAHAIGKA